MKKTLALFSAFMLFCSTAIADGVTDLPLVEHNGVLCHYYVVQPKETLYSLSNKLGLTSARIIACNPSVADGLKAHSMLYFPVEPSETQPQTIVHEVKKGETFYGLSKQFGVTTDELIAQNPYLRDGGLKAGQTITITKPAAVDIASLPASASTPAPQQEATTVTETPATTPVVTRPETHIVAEEQLKPVAVEEKPLGIAVMLPFMLAEEKPDKAAKRHTEFLKGLMLAVDTLRGEGKPVNIYAFDTAASTDTVRSILNRPELQKTTLIIGPDNEEQLRVIGDWGAKNNVMVLNLFAVRDDLYLTNPSVMQANIPHDTMYDKAIDGVTDRFPRHKFVILNRTDGASDRSEFIDELKSYLSQRGIAPVTLNFTEKLKLSDLRSLPQGEPLVFIPVSGKQAELKLIMPALTELKEEAVYPDDVVLFGYPEWTTFRGEVLTNMHKLNTTIFSRYYNIAESSNTKAIEDNFTRWFGTPIEPASPRQGLLGFDTGMMAIRALRHNAGNFDTYSPHFSGVQNGFDFRRANPSDPQSGWVNNVLYLINFRPSGVIDRTML